MDKERNKKNDIFGKVRSVAYTILPFGILDGQSWSIINEGKSSLVHHSRLGLQVRNFSIHSHTQ